MRLVELLQSGGWPMVPIYACSVAALAVFLRKLVEIGAAHRADIGWLDRTLAALREGRTGDAARACAAPHPAARAVGAAIAVLEDRPARAEAEAGRVASLEIQRLERHLGALAFIAQVAPLLGLLGTVVGMVDVFWDLERAAGSAVDVSQLSAGIWTALITTAAGLVVAVPTLAGHGYLTSRTDAMRLVIHDAVERALTAAPPASEGS